MNKKYKIIALFGKSGAGKDTIQKWITANVENTHGIISCTTRPKRDCEEDKIDYYFLSDLDFSQKILDGSILEATSFRGWFYGTPIESLNLDKINIGVFNINGIECLISDSRLDILPIYIMAPDKIRLIRNLSRENNPDCEEICRRFFTDKQDFEDIPFDYYEFENFDGEDFSIFKDVISHFGQK